MLDYAHINHIDDPVFWEIVEQINKLSIFNLDLMPNGFQSC